MRTITLDPKQQREVEILSRLEAGVVDIDTAAEVLRVGVRHVRRLRARLRLTPSHLSLAPHVPSSTGALATRLE